MCVNKRALCELEQPARQKPIIFFCFKQFHWKGLFCFANTSTYGHINQRATKNLTPVFFIFLISICSHQLQYDNKYDKFTQTTGTHKERSASTHLSAPAW